MRNKIAVLLLLLLIPIRLSSRDYIRPSVVTGWEPPSKIKVLLETCADFYNLDRSLVVAVARVESALNPLAVSRKGAVGLMQVMPSTAQWLGFDGDLTDPTLNALVGCAYLRYWMDRGLSVDGALIAYNTGSPRWSPAGGRYLEKVKCKINDKPTS